jgi:predicted MFS family arabinose efflux permease
LVAKVLGVVITLPGLAFLALPPSITALVLAGATTGIGAGLFITAIYADLSTMSTDANRGTAMSLATGAFSAAIFLGSAVSGLLIGPGGFNAILIFGAVTCLLALPLVARPVSPPLRTAG